MPDEEHVEPEGDSPPPLGECSEPEETPWRRLTNTPSWTGAPTWTRRPGALHESEAMPQCRTNYVEAEQTRPMPDEHAEPEATARRRWTTIPGWEWCWTTAPCRELTLDDCASCGRRPDTGRWLRALAGGPFPSIKFFFYF